MLGIFLWCCNSCMTWFCYILRNTNSRWNKLTYNGSTNNPIRRLRQHNEEICGGARATHGKGGGWEIYALVAGFPDHVNALSCEWRIKHPSGKPGKRDPKYCGVRGRIVGLLEVLQLDAWTKQCTLKNDCMKLQLWITNDCSDLLSGVVLPPNITVHIVDHITTEILQGAMSTTTNDVDAQNDTHPA